MKKAEKLKLTFSEKLAQTLATTSKQLVWLFSINGIIWIWCSYILAFMDKPQIAETLSSSVCTIVIGQMACYLLSKTVENVFRYNNFGGPSRYGEDNKPPKEEMINGTGDEEHYDTGGA